MADNYLEKKQEELNQRPSKVVRVNASLETLLKRNRSYRGYDARRPVTREDLLEMLKTVAWVGSGMNAQPLRFHLVVGTILLVVFFVNFVKGHIGVWSVNANRLKSIF